MGRSHELAAEAEWYLKYHRQFCDAAIAHQLDAAVATELARTARDWAGRLEAKAAELRRLADEALARELAESVEANGG